MVVPASSPQESDCAVAANGNVDFQGTAIPAGDLFIRRVTMMTGLNNGNNDDGWWSSSRSNGGTKYDNNYLWARDDDDDYYTDDDKGNYWEANKNYKSSNYVTYSGGGGSSVQNNNENYESQTFDGNKGSQQGSSGYQNQDDDQSGEINLGLLTSDQRVGFAITVSVLMVLLLFCFLFGPILVERFCSCFRSGPHTTTKIDLYSTFSNLGDF
eukprot:CAMPEP_0117079834 /NCGR_PEP_ID=MMETSP0472-20121206/56344_1 /TAXON_ID=693140 ORGANISM="Tiarina fusus, Strain LIS" /NCGR_SAMPLE_ID=MMETSP0472 /ASSEMBLY_ACC=CAM_ASM_000603 /LENGTH=211 /DNA_ID=CAMNT_0004807259 /DNA_START=122 /DNA_END=757 /DNA_ORIENTATION=-